MARTTAGKLVSKTTAAAKRVTAGVAKKATPAKSAPKPASKSTAAAKKAAPVKAPTKPAKAATKKATSSAPAKEAAAKKAPAKKVPAKTAKTAKTSKTTKTAKTSKATQMKKSAAKPDAKSAVLAVKADEDPWTAAELDEVRAELTADAERLQVELDLASRELDDLMRDAGDGAGNDQADVGSTTFERDHEMSLANNARDMLTQTHHALERIDNGTYGVCENCGQPIGKNRLMAFPRATLCLPCKQREERR
jgi:RNA polymerase-binding protein DksA